MPIPHEDIATLREQLAGSDDMLDAICKGEVDAIVVHGPAGDQIFTLKGAERSYRILVESMTEGAATVDAAGTVLYCNRRFANMVGAPLTDVIGTMIQRWVPADEMENFNAILATARERDTRGDTAFLSRTGCRLPVYASVHTLDTDEGRVLCVVATDLSEVMELRHYEQKLTAAIHARDEFITVAAHELRTPLAAMQLQVQSLQRLLDKEHSANLHERISRKLAVTAIQTERLGRLIEGLLDVSRLTSGRLQLQLEPMDLAELVRSVAERWGDVADQNKCTFDLDLRPSWGSWDKLRLEQVLTNLLSNAIKYAPGTAISVSVQPVAGNRVEMQVRDRGIGIPPEALARIFGRFERAVPTRHYGGLGLGLFIAREIVHALGGTIEAQSEMGKGATFVVSLPAQ